MDNVSINSNLIFDIEDILPATGVDINSIEILVNDFDVTSELNITGDPWGYNVKWVPYLRIYEQE